ncbi:MAG: toll/interleukin-1 receptor domain-containing protein [Anaerolineae bacterium]|nr:toll/interleukin-1 receptor domain-containing protein [Anaerolineae bacterium]
MSSAHAFTFVSHSSKDKAFVEDLAGLFDAAGLDLWVDVEDIADGATWAKSIQQGVEDCQTMIVVWSANARASEWVERETLLALRLNKPVFIAQIDDTPLPIYLINRQATDFRQRQAQATQRLIRAVQKAIDGAGDAGRKQPVLKPNEHNFFKYIAQMPEGDENSRIARELFAFAETYANAITFSGRSEPAFHAHLWVGPGGVVVFSVRAYRRQPAVEIPLQYWMSFPPYDEQKEREAVLKALNALLPDGEAFELDRADRRPNLPLVRALSTDKNLKAFERIMREVIARLNDGA